MLIYSRPGAPTAYAISSGFIPGETGYGEIVHGVETRASNRNFSKSLLRAVHPTPSGCCSSLLVTRKQRHSILTLFVHREHRKRTVGQFVGEFRI